MKKILLAFASTLVSLVLAETSIRISGDPRKDFIEEVKSRQPNYSALLENGIFRRVPDKERLYELRQGFKFKIDGVYYRINSYGLRGPEIPPKSGKTRILFLGDSYAFGLGVNEEETIPSHLERILISEGKKVEVLNAGVPGYHTGQEIAFLKTDGLALSPDMVLLLFYLNDITSEDLHYDERLHCLYSDDIPIPYTLKEVFSRSALYSLILRASKKLVSKDVKRDWDTTRKRLDSLVKTLKENKLKGVIVILPLITSTLDMRSESEWHQHYRWVEDWAVESQVEYVSLLESFRGFLLEYLLIDPGRDQHFNSGGCELVAKEIAQAIKSALP